MSSFTNFTLCIHLLCLTPSKSFVLYVLLDLFAVHLVQCIVALNLCDRFHHSLFLCQPHLTLTSASPYFPLCPRSILVYLLCFPVDAVQRTPQSRNPLTAISSTAPAQEPGTTWSDTNTHMSIPYLKKGQPDVHVAMATIFIKALLSLESVPQ